MGELVKFVLYYSVAVLIFHRAKSQVIFVKQFRPGEESRLENFYLIVIP